MPSKQSISKLEDHLGYWLRAVSNAVSHGFARKVEAEGVTVAEWAFMRVIYGQTEMSPSALAAAMGMTRGAISKLAERLEAKGLVKVYRKRRVVNDVAIRLQQGEILIATA